MHCRSTAAALATALALPLIAGSALAGAGDLASLTREEFYAAKYYRDALEHAALKRLSEAQKIRAVAKDLSLKPATLRRAIEKVEALGGDPAELAVAATKEAFQRDGRVQGRVLDVLINADQPKHVVMYVRWQGSSSQNVVKEASEIAHVVATEAPFVSTLSLAAIAPSAGKDAKDPVWSAKIGRDRMQSIQPRRIDDYADRLYKNLFEGIEEKAF